MGVRRIYHFPSLEVFLRKLSQIRDERKMRKNAELWELLQDYLRKTKSTGRGYIDYAQLYEMIRINRPVEILECGTGVTTLVIAHALMKNEEETGIAGRVTSMEEHPEWFEMSQKLLPLKYSKYVAFTLSDTVEDGYSLIKLPPAKPGVYLC